MTVWSSAGPQDEIPVSWQYASAGRLWPGRSQQESEPGFSHLISELSQTNVEKNNIFCGTPLQGHSIKSWIFFGFENSENFPRAGHILLWSVVIISLVSWLFVILNWCFNLWQEIFVCYLQFKREFRPFLGTVFFNFEGRVAESIMKRSGSSDRMLLIMIVSIFQEQCPRCK